MVASVFKYFTGAAVIIATACAAVSDLAAQQEDSTMQQKRAEARTLNTHHPFQPPATLAEWEKRADELRTQILFSAGLWPMPERTPLKPIVTGRLEIDGCIIEKVAIQTFPGFYLCGNLYRPSSGTGPFPAIANPHGHTYEGRLSMSPDVENADPVDPSPAPGRNNLVAIGVNLARQGFVVFAYDMVGYNDTNQFPDHGNVFADLRPWLWNNSLMGLQLWNSIRAVDYLESLPYVDKMRIGATGGSGGGSQTFLLAAVDRRIAAAAPVNMVSHYMQGGCLCENAPGLRLETDNAEIAALAAPRPLLLVAATGDWTRENPREEGPAIQKVYDLYGTPERTSVEQFNYEHNYNRESREAVYRWFNRWLKPEGQSGDTTETPFTLDPEQLLVWSPEHPLPADAMSEAEALEMLISESEAQLRKNWPSDAAGLRRFRQIYRPALRSSLGLEALRNVSPPQAEGPDGGAAVLVLCRGGDPQLRDLTSALHTRGVRTYTLLIPESTSNEESLWKDFYTCYNRTPTGEAVQVTLDHAAAIRADGTNLRSIVGLGDAGSIALLAAALDDGFTAVTADMNGADWDNDQSFIPDFYAPGLRRAGDLRSAAIMVGGRLLLHHSAEMDSLQDIVQARQDTGADTMVRKTRMMAAEIARELASGR